MSSVQILTVEAGDDGSRLDRWFKRLFPHIPHGRVEKLLRTGQIRVDGKRAKGNVRIATGQSVRVPPLPDPTDAPKPSKVSPRDVQFIRDLVIYEDDHVIGLNKPAGLAVQGGSKTTRHIDGMLPALGSGCRLVHRLDRDTSGVLLIAKSAAAARTIGKAFQGRNARKIYWGVTNGVPKPKAGEIKGYVGKVEGVGQFADREIMGAVEHGSRGAKHARTVYAVVSEAGKRAAWVAMMPLTGRTHQLRLHMQMVGAPIVADPKYLTDRETPGGLDDLLHLHAREISVPLENGKTLTITAPLPPHMARSFAQLGFHESDPQPEMELEP